jgi:hypothetical protein
MIDLLASRACEQVAHSASRQRRRSSTNSLALHAEEGTSRLAATARARSVFCRTWRPDQQHALGTVPPRRGIFARVLEKSTISTNSFFASSMPLRRRT